MADRGAVHSGTDRPRKAMTERARIDQPIHGQLRCVWSSHPQHGRSCHEQIPRQVTAAAWDSHAAREGVKDGFFYITWRGGVWLAYRVPGGGIRGVYCPTHCAQREARTPSAVTGPEVGRAVWALAV